MKKQATYTVVADVEVPGMGRMQCRVKRPSDKDYVFKDREEAEQVMTSYLTTMKDFKTWDCQIVTKR